MIVLRSRALVLIAVLACGSVVLIWPAALNGYPLVYWDSGAYIWSSLDHVVPVDRTIGYGLFVGWTSVFHTLWLTIGLQALITSYLLIRNLMHILPGTFGRRAGLSLAVLVLTALTTGAARYVAYVMPDISASWMILGALLLVLGRRWVDRIVAGLAVVIAVLAHNSNFLLGVACAAVLLVGAARLLPSIHRRSIRDVVTVMVLAVATAGLLNWELGAGFVLSRGGPTFMVNRLAASGVLSKTLATYCPAAGWQLCAFQNVIEQVHADPGWWFLWGDDSPLRVLGWEQGEGEQTDVVRHALQCCLGPILVTSAESSWQQLQHFNSAQDLPRLGADTSAYNAIRIIYPDDFLTFLNGAQQSGNVVRVQLPAGDNPWLYACMASLAALVARICWRRGLGAPTLFLLVALASVLLNAALMGSLNGADDRQQGRIAWLVPCALWAGLIVLARSRRGQQVLVQHRLMRLYDSLASRS